MTEELTKSRERFSHPIHKIRDPQNDFKEKGIVQRYIVTKSFLIQRLKKRFKSSKRKKLHTKELP